MLADFFSKPLQGALFIRFCDMIMGHAVPPPVEDPSLRSCAAQERVGNKKFGPDDQRTDGPDDQWTDGVLSTPETQRRVTWADVVKISKNSKLKKENLVIGRIIIS